MSANQFFFGMLGFEAPDDAASALADAAEIAGPAGDLVMRARREDCVVTFDLHGSMPSSLWLHLSGALAELGARARTGHVRMLYEGDGTEDALGGPFPQARPTPSPRPSRWMPLDGAPGSTLHHELVRRGQPTMDAEFEIVAYAGGQRALDVGDWLGLFMDLVPDGERLFACAQPWNRSPPPALAGLELVAELDRPGATHLFAHPNKELMTVFRVIGTAAARLTTRTIERALAIDVDEHHVPLDVHELRSTSREPRTRRRLWLEEGRGLVAIHDR